MEKKWSSLKVLLVFFATIISFQYILTHQGVTRQEVIFLLNTQAMSEYVNHERTINSAPNTLKIIFSNKLTYTFFEFSKRYLEAFSLTRLFATGEGGIYGTYRHGFFYLIELPLLLLGLYALFRNESRKTIAVIISGILIGPLPSAISIDPSYALRSVAMFPFLIMVTGYGGYTLYKYFLTHKKQAKLLISAFFSLYFIFIAGYFYLYMFRYSVYGAEYYFASNRDIMNLVNQKKDMYDTITIVDPGPMFVFQYGFYSHATLEEVVDAWRMPWPKKIQNTRLIEKCNGPILNKQENELVIANPNCFKDSTPSATILDKAEPLRTIWNIY